MKRSLLIGFRALVFGLGVFVLLALTGIQIRSSMDVTLFVLGAAVFWVLFEQVFLGIMVRGRKKAPRPPH